MSPLAIAQRDIGRSWTTWLNRRKHIHYSVKKGPHFATEVKQLETDLTADMIAKYVARDGLVMSSGHIADLYQRVVEGRLVQAVQLCRGGPADRGWSAASSPQGPRRVPTNLLRHGVGVFLGDQGDWGMNAVG